VTRGRDHGSGTVLMLGLGAVVMVLLAVVVLLGQAVSARHRAAVAADLAALAAADVLLGRASGEPCARAGRVAGAHGAELTSCTPAADRTVTVSVALTPGGAAASLGTAVATARAGPGHPAISSDELG